jgi:CheY-like chemotaxis protein
MLERHPKTQVVALTAMHDPAVADQALRAGFSGYLTKETNLANLQAADQQHARLAIGPR